STIVPAKTQVSTEQPDDQGRIVFETDKAITVIRSQLSNLLSDDNFNFRDISNDNLDTLIEFQPFGPAATAGDSFMLGFAEALPASTIHFYVWSPRPVNNNGAVVSQCFHHTERVTSTRLAWEYWNGREWSSLTLLKDDTTAFTRSGEILIKAPAEGSMASEIFGELEQARFWIRARITHAGYEQAPAIVAIRTNVAPVTQAQTIEYESIGGSNGEIDQTHRLRYSPLIAGSLVLEIDEGDGYREWQEVVDFYGSGKDDPHYVLNRGTGEIRFSDGTKGRVPVANAKNRSNIRARIYRFGGGKRGNVAANKINQLQNTLNGIKAEDVSNLFESVGGADEETLDAAIRRAPQTLKSRERAVTAEDYEALALRSTNIARAKALPLYHPHHPTIEVPGVVTVMVIPDIDDPAPVPSAGTLKTVCHFLDQRRLLTTELYVLGPQYQRVQVHAQLIAEDTADLAEIKSAALDNLALYFHPLHGGEDSDPEKPQDDPERSGGGWPFGGDIYYSLLYRRLLFSGVKRIVSLAIEVEGEPYPQCQDVPIDKGILLLSGEHTIDIDYELNNGVAG
ncbi:MAG: putative baseplate assembly protein, partial [Pseudomonadota bacterium]